MSLTTKAFLAEFTAAYYFPSPVGPWIYTDQHDLPWTEAQLRLMAKRGIIELDLPARRYRMTMKASKLKGTTV